MKTYETTFICSPQLSPDEITVIIEKVKTIIAKEGGKIVTINDWGKKRLAYQINKFREGHYVHIVTETTPQTVSLLDIFYGINENILRHMTVCAHPASLVKPPVTAVPQQEQEKKAVEPIQSETIPTTEEVKSNDVATVTNE